MKICLTCGEKQPEGKICNGCGHLVIHEPPPPPPLPLKQAIARKGSR